MKRSLAISLLMLAACRPDLGECDQAALDNSIVFLLSEGGAATDGQPMYAGQALIQTECVSCHAESATGVTRGGAPAGLDFDLSIACDDAEDYEACSDDDKATLLGQASNVFEHRALIWSTVHNETMPPGPAGQARIDGAPGLYRRYTDAEGAQEPLGRLSDAESRETLRNWLACGAPTISTTLTVAQRTGLCLNERMETISDCAYRVNTAPVDLEPTFSSIFDNVLSQSRCTSCHSAEAPDQDSFAGSGNLAFDEVGASHERLLADPAGGACAGSSAMVVPGDCDGSQLIQKLRGDGGCGDPMPPQATNRLAASQIDVICEWINAGAMNN